MHENCITHPAHCCLHCFSPTAEYKLPSTQSHCFNIHCYLHAQKNFPILSPMYKSQHAHLILFSSPKLHTLSALLASGCFAQKMYIQHPKRRNNAQNFLETLRSTKAKLNCSHSASLPQQTNIKERSTQNLQNHTKSSQTNKTELKCHKKNLLHKYTP